VVSFKPSEEYRIMFSCETEATSVEVYRQYAIKKRDREHSHIDKTVGDPKLKAVLHKGVHKFWEKNKDCWNPADFPAYRIELTSDEAPYEQGYRTS